MDEILEKYEQFVEKLLSKNIHYNIIPKQYQRECYSKSFGDVFSRTPDDTFRQTFGNAFKSNNHLNQYLARTGNNDVAFETMFHYKLVTPWWTQLLSHQYNIMSIHNVLLSELERLKNYNDGVGKNYEKDLRRTTLLHHFRIFQRHWELIHWKYLTISYSYVTENLSDDAKRKFREIDLTFKDQYIKVLEDILQWKEKEPTEKMTMFQKRYQEEQLELSELRNQRNSLIREIKEKGGDKAIKYQDHTFTGECMVNENERLSEIETKAITDLIPIQFNLHAQRDEILSLENSISQLHDSILTRLLANKETASTQQIEVYRRLRHLLTLDMPMEEQLGKLALDFKNSRSSLVDSAIYNTTKIDMWIKTITTAGFAKRNKDKEQQESKIDQLEMKIIRHSKLCRL